MRTTRRQTMGAMVQAAVMRLRLRIMKQKGLMDRSAEIHQNPIEN